MLAMLRAFPSLAGKQSGERADEFVAYSGSVVFEVQCLGFYGRLKLEHRSGRGLGYCCDLALYADINTLSFRLRMLMVLHRNVGKNLQSVFTHV